MKYNPFPLGDWYKQWPDFYLSKVMQQYAFKDPRDACYMFEQMLCEFTGAPYCVLTDSCTNALFLSLLEWGRQDVVLQIPAKTYVSVPMAALNAGYKIKFVSKAWVGEYKIEPFPLWDSAMTFYPAMYCKESVTCLSFQLKKRLPIGKGGAILLDNEFIYKKLKKMAYEGRDISLPYDKDDINILGYNCYMRPEDAAKGICILDDLCRLEVWNHVGGSENYPDIENLEVFKQCKNVLR